MEPTYCPEVLASELNMVASSDHTLVPANQAGEGPLTSTPASLPEHHNTFPTSSTNSNHKHFISNQSSVLRDAIPSQQFCAPAFLESCDTTRQKPSIKLATADAMADKEIEKGDEGESMPDVRSRQCAVARRRACDRVRCFC